MRSRNSSNEAGRSILLHDCGVVLKECLIPAVFGLIVFGILLPGSAAALPDTSIFNLEYTHDQLKFSFFSESMLIPIRCAAVLFGGGMGLRIFSFLADKRKSAFVLSLGLSRKKLFAVRAGMGTISILVSTGIPVLISWILNRVALGDYRGMGSSAWNIFIVLALQCVVSMLAASAACSVAGTAAESGILAATFLAAPTVMLFSLNTLMKTFLWGNVYGETTYALKSVEDGLTEKTELFNPMLFSGDGLDKYGRFWRALDQSYPDPVDWRPAAVWAAAAILLAVLCAFLFYRRKAENAGISGLSRLHNLLIRVVWPVLVFGLVMEGLRSTGHAPSFLAALAAALLMLAMIDLLFTRERSSLTGRWIPAGALLLCLLLSAGIVRSGLFGFASGIPAEEQIQSVSVTFPGEPALLTQAASSVTSGSSYYNEVKVELSDEDSIRLVRDLHRKVIETGYTDCGSEEVFEKSVFPYDVSFTYTLTSGKTVGRYYDRIRLDVLEEFLNLENSQALRAAEAMVVRGESASRLWNSHAFAEGKIYVTGSDMAGVREIQADEQGRSELLQAMAEDLTEQSVEDRYFPESSPLGTIFFTLNGESDTEQFRTSTSNARIDITAFFTKTIRLLSGWGLDLPVGAESGTDAAETDTADGDPAGGGTAAGASGLSAENVESVTLQKFDPYASMNRMRSPISLLFQSYRSQSDSDFILTQDFGTRPALTDRGQIDEILPALRSSYFMSKGGYLAAVKFRGSNRFTYMFIPYDSAPEFLRVKMG